MRFYTLFTSVLFCFAAHVGVAQTTYVLDPNGDGGFESGLGWAANGWSVANDATNTWNLGTKATGYTGNRAAFISENGGSTWTYNITAGTKSYLYRDVAVPNVSYPVYLSFSWTGQGESGWDDLEVYKVNTDNTPAGGSSLYNPKTKLGGPYGEVSSWQGVTIDISGYKGQTIRLVFAWKCGTTTGVQPPHALDNVAVYYTIPLSGDGLISLNGNHNDKINANEIAWVISDENDVKEFSVERSKDGAQWLEVSKINASENVFNYSALDKNPLSGSAYYRIKQIQKDGSFFYSEAVMVKKTLSADFAIEGIFPNPTSSKLNISLAVNTTSQISVKVIDLLGKVVYANNTASAQMEIDTEHFHNGIYLLVVSSENETTTKRIVVQH